MFLNRGGRHYYFSKYLKEKGYEVSIFCAATMHNFDRRFVSGRQLYSVQYLDGIRFVFVRSTPYKGNKIGRIANMVSFYLNVKRTAKKIGKDIGEPDLILASSVHPLTMAAGVKAAKKKGIPCICEVRDLWPEALFAIQSFFKPNGLLGRLLTAGEHWIYRKADALIFTKEGDRDYLIEKKWDQEQGGDINLDKVFYINNGVDLDFFEKAVSEHRFADKDLEEDSFKVVYAGAIREVNKVDRIIEAAELLRDDDGIRFLIFGDGDLVPLLEQKIHTAKLTNVVLKGHVNRRYIPYVLSKSNLNLLNYSSSKFVLRRGNSSNKLFEYMASGKPILSNVKFAYSIIEKYDCGLELENDSAEAYAKAIKYVRNLDHDHYEQFGSNAKKGARDFDFQVLTEKLVQVIHAVGDA